MLKNCTLEPGKYKATVSLIGADSKTEVGRRSIDFVRETYPWEGNSLGKSDKVIPPYAPIKSNVAKKEFSVCLRDYKFGNNGLFEKITAAGGTGPENILRSPMELIAVIKGKKTVLQNAKLAVKKVNDGKVEMEIDGTLDRVKCRLDSTRLSNMTAIARSDYPYRPGHNPYRSIR